MDEQLQALKERLTNSFFILGRTSGKTQLVEDVNNLLSLIDENKRLREALQKILEEEETNLEGYETPVYQLAKQALGGE